MGDRHGKSAGSLYKQDISVLRSQFEIHTRPDYRERELLGEGLDQQCYTQRMYDVEAESAQH